jgi:hypothetical protein
MTSSDHDGANDAPESRPTQLELVARGWERRFIYDEPRLSEAVDTYRELGFEVLLLPVAVDDRDCTECMLQEPDRFRVIYTRKRHVDDSSSSEWEEDI